ncbi:NAD-binding protein [Sphingomonas histidinilytica]|uniref:Tartronate semialdehyde reductase n=1 Tax=Rhizorhabdus histidinilytica TaxID=439228 RepID=A0A1T5CWQ2_9SPHN|nr:NAD(P)-dependent oxidoreductase [Rhizorhabdus histidinilytica]MBO9376276.1 NAD-binding protein [Rhizorhabdus histidinilytica]SKB63756.1 tartronate semialdehyde reductase [Rhizorhabdus histidinilytica]
MRIGFIGLGVQGLPLALNLLDGGHELSGFDVRPEPLDALRERGGTVAASPAELGAVCEVVMICVVSDQQVRDVLTGEDGVLASPRPGLIVVLHSSVSTDTIAEAAGATRERGVVLVDAPVSGGAQGARTRTMSFMVGGEEEALDRCQPLFELSGPNILRTGPTGTATLAKLAHQVAIIGNIMAMAEAVRLGTAGGLSAEMVKRAVAGGLARSWIAETWGEIKMAPHALPLYAKDLENSLRFAKQIGISLPGAELMKLELPNIVP